MTDLAAHAGERMLLKNLRVLDPDVEGAVEPVDILVEHGRIASVGKVDAGSEDCLTFDFSGKFALPGLIDCHVHPFLAETNLSRLSNVPPTLMTARAVRILEDMLLRGFTSVRDATGADWGIKQAIDDGTILGPRLFIAGRAISQTGGHGDFRSLTDDHMPCGCAHALTYTSRIADGCDEVRKAVREELRSGADQIKIMVSGGVSSPHDPLEADQFSREEIRTVVEEATRCGSYVMAHAYGASAIKMALECGVRTIEHANLIDEEAAALAAKSGAYVVPTLVTYEVLGKTARAEGWSEEMLGKLDKVAAAGLNSIKICKEHGVKLGFGTDLLGDSFDHQMEEFTIRSRVETPREIIRSATKVNAEIVQRTGELGVIAAGAIADIIVLDANPFDNLSVLTSPERNSKAVILKGGKPVWQRKDVRSQAQLVASS